MIRHALGAHRRWWASLLQSGGAARGDLAGGLTAALVLPTIEGGYGLIAFSPLGSEQAQLGFLRYRFFYNIDDKDKIVIMVAADTRQQIY